MSRTGAAAVLAGVALLAAHAVIAPALVRWTARAPLRVRAEGPLVVDDAATAPIAGHALGGLHPDEDDDGAAPGLVRHRWLARYRGGIERTVGRVRLLGPLQDVAAPPCGGRLAVGQRLLDDGHAGPGTVAGVLARELSAALRDVDVTGAGDFRTLEHLEVGWATLALHPYEIGLFPRAALSAPVPTGYLRAAAIARFQRVDVPIVVGALPRIDGGQLGFTVGVRARLDFDNRVLDWINDKVGGDRIVTRIANGELDRSLLAALGPPPPLPLPGGRTLTVELCPGRAVDVTEGVAAAVPVRWKLGGAPGDDGVRPPQHAPIAWPPPEASAPLTLDLDLDGLDGLAYELWRTGYLDELLERLELPRRFDEHPLVRDLLSLRLARTRLALPPTLAAGAGASLRLSLVLAVELADGGLTTPGTAWGVLDVGLGATPAPSPSSPSSPPSPSSPAIAASVDLAGLDLTCEPEPGLLVPCYGDLLASVRAATGGVHDAMSAALGDALTALFVDRRLSAASAPAALAITGARARVLPAGPVVRVELDARLEP